MSILVFFPILILGLIILLWMYLRDRKKVRTTSPQEVSVGKIGFFITIHILFTSFLIWLVCSIVFVAFGIVLENTAIDLALLILAFFLGAFLGSKIGVGYAIRRFQIKVQQIENISKSTASYIILISILYSFLGTMGEKMNNNILIVVTFVILISIIVAFASFISVRHFLRKAVST